MTTTLTRSTLKDSLLESPESLPLYAGDSLRHWGRTLVIAPHPDDESLGCGGVIALLREAGVEVAVVLVSDGAKSHPNSTRYPGPKLAALRAKELLNALEILGVEGDYVQFLELPDGSVPQPGEAGFDEAAADMQQALADFEPQTILVPWRRDPHGDHRASWHLAQHAHAAVESAARILEYPIWVWEAKAPEQAPQAEEVEAWRVDIEPVLKRKKQAIAAHASQTTRLINDDPEGFMLRPEVLAHFHQPWETFFENRD
ncbi:MAG: hypothetical protein E1N59_1990 [Puniceicoccaceae bacterium 5H]|nr:MAG: hypothetical protein E1N59_1990 [Puniceicoccaceae bacterium 5H]